MKIKSGIVLIVLLSLMVFSACTDFSDKDEEGQGELVLKTYMVPEGLAKEVSITINELLGWKHGRSDEGYPPIGKAIMGPNGQVLVTAPESFHDGIQDFLARVQIPAPEHSLTAEVHYWMVAGRKANAPSKLEESNRIKPALETIQDNQGNMEFKILDHVAVTVTSIGENTFSKINGAFFEIDQMFYANNPGAMVISPTIKNIAVRLENGEYKTFGTIATRIETRSGELVILGQESQKFYGLSIFEPQNEGENNSEIVNVYYIISATIKK